MRRRLLANVSFIIQLLLFAYVRLQRLWGDVQSIVTDRVRDARKIPSVMFQHSVLLLGRGCASFHAALGATDTHTDHIAGDVFVDGIEAVGGRLVAIGAGK